MKLIVTKPERDIRLLLPTGLVLNGLSAQIVSLAMRKKDVRLSPAQLSGLFRELRRFKREHPDWVLVEAETASGEYITVRL